MDITVHNDFYSLPSLLTKLDIEKSLVKEKSEPPKKLFPILEALRTLNFPELEAHICISPYFGEDAVWVEITTCNQKNTWGTEKFLRHLTNPELKDRIYWEEYFSEKINRILLEGNEKHAVAC